MTSKFTGWWDDIVVTGVVPFLALVFFNLQIYCKIRCAAKILRKLANNFCNLNKRETVSISNG